MILRGAWGGLAEFARAIIDLALLGVKEVEKEEGWVIINNRWSIGGEFEKSTRNWGWRVDLEVIAARERAE